MSVIRVVLDTNILFEGLTKRGGACGLIIDAWQARLFSVCISNALAYEYQDVLYRPDYVRRSRRRTRSGLPGFASTWGQASSTQVEEVLAKREEVEPEPELKPELIEKVRQRIEEKKNNPIPDENTASNF